MNIMYTFNNNFVPQIMAGMVSVCEHNKNVTFYLIMLEVDKKNIEKIKKLANKYKAKVKFVDIGNLEKYFDFDFDTNGWNKIVLARLLIDKLLPNNINRILYLDGDTIVRGSLENLYNLYLKENVLGMSIEPTCSYESKKNLGIYNRPYCNAGVLLINMSKWRETHAGKRVINFYKEHKGNLFANDQDAINGTLKDEIYIISPRYNYYNVYDQYSYSFMNTISNYSDYITREDYYESRKNPIIVHYLGEERPWRKGNHHRFKKDFVDSIKLAGFDKVPEEENWELYFVCWYIFNFIMKPFPKIRQRIIDKLIPVFMNYRKNKLKRTNSK